MFRQVSQEAPCDNLASKGSSLENATVIVFDVREERLDDPNRPLDPGGWAETGDAVHKCGDNAWMMTAIGKRSNEWSEYVSHGSCTKLFKCVGCFDGVDKIPYKGQDVD